MTKWKDKTRGGHKFRILDENLWLVLFEDVDNEDYSSHVVIGIGEHKAARVFDHMGAVMIKPNNDFSEYDLIPAGPSKPEDGDKVWSIAGTGEVLEIIYGSEFSIDAWTMGNVYPTEEAATRVRDADRLTTDIDRWIEEKGAGVDWDDMETRKYSIVFQYNMKGWEVSSAAVITRNPFVVYVSTQDFARDLIAEFGDRMKELLL